MMPEAFFTGQTERFLLSALEENGKLPYTFIYSYYSTPAAAKSFIKKLVNLGIARVKEVNMITWIPHSERA